MASLSLTPPTIGQPNSTEDVDIVNAFTAISNWAGSSDFANIQTDYNNIIEFHGHWSTAAHTGAGNYIVQRNHITPSPLSAATSLMSSVYFYLDPANYALSGRTAKLRVYVVHDTNSQAMGMTITYGLYPITVTRGGAGAVNIPNLGAGVAVTGSTVPFASIAANTTATANSGDFTCPTAGIYVLVGNCSAAVTTNGRWDFHIELQRRTIP